MLKLNNINKYNKKNNRHRGEKRDLNDKEHIR